MAVQSALVSDQMRGLGQGYGYLLLYHIYLGSVLVDPLLCDSIRFLVPSRLRLEERPTVAPQHLAASLTRIHLIRIRSIVILTRWQLQAIIIVTIILLFQYLSLFVVLLVWFIRCLLARLLVCLQSCASDVLQFDLNLAYFWVSLWLFLLLDELCFLRALLRGFWLLVRASRSTFRNLWLEMIGLLCIGAQKLLLTLVSLNLKPAFTWFLYGGRCFGRCKIRARHLLDIGVVGLNLGRKSSSRQAYVLDFAGSFISGVFNGC